MSYTIFYRSMYVKLSNGKYIPMMEMGDNNVYEHSYGRGKAKRTRNWSNMRLNHEQKFFDETEIRNHLAEWNESVEKKRENDLLNGDDWQKDAAKNGTFGYYEGIAVYGKGGTSGTTFNDVKNIVMGGVKNCISLEDAIKHCGLHIYYWEKTNPNDSMFACQKTLYFSDENEMYDLIYENFIRESDNKSWYFVFTDGFADRFYNLRKTILGFMKKGKTRNFVLRVLEKDNTPKYVAVKDNSFVLVDELNNAKIFSKYSSNGMNINEFMFKAFPSIYSIKYVYEYC